MLKNNLIIFFIFFKSSFVYIFIVLIYYLRPLISKMPSKNDFFYFELVSGFLALCQAKWNEILRTNPGYGFVSILFHLLDKLNCCLSLYCRILQNEINICVCSRLINMKKKNSFFLRQKIYIFLNTTCKFNIKFRMKNNPLKYDPKLFFINCKVNN